MAGLLRPSSGTVALGGVPAADLAPRELARRIALAPQEDARDLPLTVGEFVALGRTPWLGRLGVAGPADAGAVRAALARFRLAAMSSRLLPTLSGGEHRRAILARACAQGAPILLLDEPTAHLDPAQATAVWRDLARMAQAGMTVVAATHDLGHVRRTADRAWLLAGGRLAAAGAPRAVFASRAARRAFGAAVRTGR